MSDQSDKLLPLFRSVGRIEGMLTQFLGAQAAQDKRIEVGERKDEEHSYRLGALEKLNAKRAGYTAGIAVAASAIFTGASYLVGMILKGLH